MGASTYSLTFNCKPADDRLLNVMGALELEENADMPGAVRFSVPVEVDGSGDLTFVNDQRLQPFVNLAVVATPKGQAAQCLFDRVILSSKLHLQKGTTGSSLQVWGRMHPGL